MILNLNKYYYLENHSNYLFSINCKKSEDGFYYKLTLFENKELKNIKKRFYISLKCDEVDIAIDENKISKLSKYFINILNLKRHDAFDIEKFIKLYNSECGGFINKLSLNLILELKYLKKNLII